MGKGKGKGDEHASRVNFLFQAGKTVAEECPQLSQFYGEVLTVITEKTAPKKDFTLKRSMCKKCRAILEIGINATYRLRKSRHKKGSPTMIIGCKLCGEIKCIPTTNPAKYKPYRLKAEREGQILDCSSRPKYELPTAAGSSTKVDTDGNPNPVMSETIETSDNTSKSD